MKKTYCRIGGMILLGFVLAGVFLSLAPERIPVHYDIHGQVDRWGSKYEFLVMPFINLLFGVVMALLARNEGRKEREMNEKVVSGMTVWVLLLFNALWTFFMWKAVDSGASGDGLGDLGIKVLLVMVMASLIPLGNRMPKAQRNSMLGLRTKWSMADDWTWQQSQRVGGFAMVITGVVGVAAISLAPAQWGGYIMLALIAAMAVVCTAASYRIFRKREEKENQ